MTGLKRIEQRRFVDQTAARAINDAHAATSPGQALRVQQVTSFWSERGVESDEIRRRQEIVELIYQLDLQATGSSRRQIRIISKHAHSECDRSSAQFTADASHADDAESFVVELHSLKIRSGPAAAPNTGISLRNLAGDTQQKRKRMLRGRYRVTAGSVQHNNSATRG